MRGLKDLFDHRLGRFMLVGLSNTALGLLVIFGCKAYLGFGDAAANVTGYALLIAVSFSLNRRWAFEDGGDAARSLLRFVLVLAAAYLANLATTLAAIDLLHVAAWAAVLLVLHAGAVVPVAAMAVFWDPLCCWST